jgi:hypothetical protein
MLTFEQARKIASDRVSAFGSSNDTFIIIDSWTVEKPYAWIFCYTSKLWYETRDDKYLIAGNAPIIVDKQTGKMTSFSTAYGIDSIIEMYEEERNLWSLVLADRKALDHKKLLQLKYKLDFGNDKLIQLKNGNIINIDSGSELRLASLQAELSDMGVETKLILSWDNK